MDWILNGMSINETEIIAYAWGRVGVPVIFASGDDKLKEQLGWMDWLRYVTVKTATSADHAELRPFDDVHEEMRLAAAAAVENLPSAKAVALTTPILAQLRAVHPANLSQMEGVPGIDYADQTVSFEARDYQEAYDGIEALIGVATGSYSDLMAEVLAGEPNRAELVASHRAMLFQRWVDVESGRWTSPDSRAGTPSNRRYFGVR
jgi:D-aminopeptidase